MSTTMRARRRLAPPGPVVPCTSSVASWPPLRAALTAASVLEPSHHALRASCHTGRRVLHPPTLLRAAHRRALGRAPLAVCWLDPTPDTPDARRPVFGRVPPHVVPSRTRPRWPSAATERERRSRACSPRSPAASCPCEHRRHSHARPCSPSRRPSYAASRTCCTPPRAQRPAGRLPRLRAVPLAASAPRCPRPSLQACLSPPPRTLLAVTAPSRAP